MSSPRPQASDGDRPDRQPGQESGQESGPEPGQESSREPDRPSGLSRRRLFAGAAGGVGAGALLGVGGTLLGTRGIGSASAADSLAAHQAEAHNSIDLTKIVPFYDQPHQAGVATLPQRHTVFMTFDLSPSAGVSDLQVLLARWTAAIGQMTSGKTIGQVRPEREDAVGQDTGEALNLDPSSLTVTVGLGPGVFGSQFGLAAKRPKLLAALPRIPGDKLVAARSGGDLSIQACADDPQVAYHAVRNLARMVTTTAQTRWVVLGFGRASSGKDQETPRNLFGFKDGTRNIKSDADLDDYVWVGDDGWMNGGTYQVVRKIRMTIEDWDGDRVSDQENVIGRSKIDGGPLSGGTEFVQPDFGKLGADGEKLIPPASHVALASPENNRGVKILRRGYNYTDGLNDLGLLDAGLLFIAYMKDPDYFVQLQTRLGNFDLMNEYIEHIGSGIFAVPPAPKTGSYIGQELFA